MEVERSSFTTRDFDVTVSNLTVNVNTQLCSRHLFLINMALLEFSFHTLWDTKTGSYLARLKPQLQQVCFPGPHLTHFTCEASQNPSLSLFNHYVRIIQHVSASNSVSIQQALPFSLCVVQHCTSLGYPPQYSNNTTSCWKVEELFA